eukprot:1386435-Amorphochlora_amoeboformis.AAC.1
MELVIFLYTSLPIKIEWKNHQESQPDGRVSLLDSVRTDTTPSAPVYAGHPVAGVYVALDTLPLQG